jgi:hypothetical protein
MCKKLRIILILTLRLNGPFLFRPLEKWRTSGSWPQSRSVISMKEAQDEEISARMTPTAMGKSEGAVRGDEKRLA